MKFKVGDKVRIVSIPDVHGSVSKKDINKEGIITVVYDRHYILDENKYCANFKERDVKLAKPKKKLTNADRTKLINETIKYINNNNNYKCFFNDVEKEVEGWDDDTLLDWEEIKE